MAVTVATIERGQISAAQYPVFMSPLKAGRVATRKQSGKTLSYLESWDVRAHLIRMFGFGNFDIETVEQHLVGLREYTSSGDSPKPMIEPMWFAKVRLVVRDNQGREIARYMESAVGANASPDYLLAEAHDNSIKTAASDALKRCAINLGTQFGLSLYDNGSKNDVVKATVVTPEGYEAPKPDPAATAAVDRAVGGDTPREGTEPSNEGHVEPEAAAS